MPYFLQTTPFVVPTSDGKMIEEHEGLASTGNGVLSIARMVAPPDWGEPFQTPEFDEYTLVCSGRKQVEVDGEVLVLAAGESIRIERGTRVRYSNPFPEPCSYWSVCMPAFNIHTVNREV